MYSKKFTLLKSTKKVFCLLLLNLKFIYSATEYFSSLAHLKELSKIEESLVDKLELYIRQQEKLLNFNKRYVREIEDHFVTDPEDVLQGGFDFWSKI